MELYVMFFGDWMFCSNITGLRFIHIITGSYNLFPVTAGFHFMNAPEIPHLFCSSQTFW